MVFLCLLTHDIRKKLDIDRPSQRKLSEHTADTPRTHYEQLAGTVQGTLTEPFFFF